MSDKSALHEKLVAWAKERFICGWSPDDLIQGMVKVGHPSDYAQRFVSGILAQRNTENTQPSKQFLASNPSDTDAMQFPNSIRLADCKVSILFASAHPRIILMGDLLSADECISLIEMARPELKRAKVVDEKTGEHRIDPLRASATKNCSYKETPVVEAVEARIAALFGHPVTHQEQMQVMHYPVGGLYKPHNDYFDPALPGSPAILKRGGQRIATVVIYLNDVEEGGGTVFPKLGLESRPKRGNAVYFESVDEFGQIDPRLLHTGAPVIQGEKWIAVKWIRAEEWCNI